MSCLRSITSGHVSVQLEPLGQMIRSAGVRAHSVIRNYKHQFGIRLIDESPNSFIKRAVDFQESILVRRRGEITPQIVSAPVTCGIDSHEEIRRSSLDQILGCRSLDFY